MSAPKEDQLLVAKQRLMYALGDSQPIYLANLKQWFRQKWTKEEFDRESRKLLGLDQAHLHNQFFLALLNKIEPLHAKCPVVDSVVGSATSQRAATFQNSSVMMDGVNPTLVQPMNVPPRVGADAGVSSSAAKRRKRSSRPTADRATFDSADVFDYLAEESFDGVRPPGAISPPRSLSPQRFSVQELFLPDAGLVMGRLLVGAWESGLVSAEENVSELIVLAVQNLLKNIITAILLKRKHYRVTGGGSFVYDIGVPLADPTLRTTLQRQHIDDGPIEIDKTITSMSVIQPDKRDDILFVSRCEDLIARPRRRINILDLYRALNDRQIIPSHSVHSINMERISQMLH